MFFEKGRNIGKLQIEFRCVVQKIMLTMEYKQTISLPNQQKGKKEINKKIDKFNWRK